VRCVRPCRASSEPVTKTAEFECFKTLLLALLGAVEEHRAEMGSATRHFLREVIENLPWSPAQQQQIFDLLEKGESQQIRPYRPGQLKTLMSHLTVWLQERLDKDIAILAIRQAIKETGKTLAGTEYPPKAFFSK
jgi:thioesterase domain-containing protein